MQTTEETKQKAAAAAAALASGEKTIEQVVAETGWPVIDGCVVPEPGVWHADDGNAEVIEEHPSGRAAAQSYVDGGDWGDRDSTIWISVSVWRVGIGEDGDECRVNEASHKIALDPDEPDCTHEDGHDWQSPYEILGGCKENPGVWGSGGSVACTEVCMHCGCGKTTDHWAQDPEDGQQGLTSVRYEEREYEDQVRDLRLAEMPAVEEDEGEFSTDRLVYDDGHGQWYLVHVNGGERGAHQMDNSFPSVLAPSDRLNTTAAIQWLVDEANYSQEDARQAVDAEEQKQ